MHTALIYLVDRSGWLAGFIYYDYYWVDVDKEFLKKQGSSVYEGSCTFYEGFIVKDEHGKEHDFPLLVDLKTRTG